MSIADPNKTILTGENPFIRLSPKDGEPNSTEASYWRIIFSPAGPGHVLYLKSELTERRWRIYFDNIAMARWLQSTVQGMLNAELSDTTIPCADAQFSKAGDPRYFWTEYIRSHGEEISLTWFDIGEPLLIHAQPNQIPDRRYGVCTVLIPALGTRLVRNGVEAEGRSWPRNVRGGHSRRRRWHSRKARRKRSEPQLPISLRLLRVLLAGTCRIDEPVGRNSAAYSASHAIGSAQYAALLRPTVRRLATLYDEKPRRQYPQVPQRGRTAT